MTDQTQQPDQPADSGIDIAVKVRQRLQAAQTNTAEPIETDELVAEYEERYQSKVEEKPKKLSPITLPPPQKRKPKPPSQPPTENERLWAALAHASILLTLALAIPSATLTSFITIFIPLGIYFYWRDSSEFVAHHALQAFAAQVVGIVGFVLLFTMVSIVWAILLVVSAILILILIGIPLFILVLVAGVFAIPATFILPLAALIYGMIATVEAWNGQAYKYPWIGDWVDNQLYDNA